MTPEWLTVGNHQRLIRMWLQSELVNDNNGRTQHWSKASKRKKAFVEQLTQLGAVRNEPYGFFCNLVITRILGKNQREWDSDSVLRGNAKELVDALVFCNWFKDDKPSCLHVIGNQDASRRMVGPSIEIEVWKPGK